ncbi:hypothetical protein, partial [Solidesulfovibrio sp. C21]|uniref:hypothetical protein n=1 Tax=Solidesulfovibrio sp. C21 TaxID=3398613 RepID=UPI0039FC5CEA
AQPNTPSSRNTPLVLMLPWLSSCETSYGRKLKWRKKGLIDRLQGAGGAAAMAAKAKEPPGTHRAAKAAKQFRGTKGRGERCPCAGKKEAGRPRLFDHAEIFEQM